jgi:hypothetical protein
MKRTLIALAMFLLACTAQAQSNNFVCNDGRLLWQKVYESQADIVSLLTNSGKFTDIKVSDALVSARMTPCRVDLNGRSTMQVPIFIRDYNMSCYVRIQQKEGRYRVTADNFMFYDRYDSNSSGTELEFWYIRRDKTAKPAFFDITAPILDDMLTPLFQASNDLDNDW